MPIFRRTESTTAPLAIGGKTITLVARGRAVRVGNESSSAFHVRLRPTHVETLDGDGRHDVVRIRDVEGTLMVAIVVAGLAGAIAIPNPSEVAVSDYGTGEVVPREAQVTSGIDRMMTVSADRVYRDPVRVGDRVIIPAATIAYGGGFGFGGDHDFNGGGGGGGWNDGRPIAIIEAGPDGVKVRPVVDFTRIGLTLIAAGLAIWRATRR